MVLMCEEDMYLPGQAREEQDSKENAVVLCRWAKLQHIGQQLGWFPATERFHRHQELHSLEVSHVTGQEGLLQDVVLLHWVRHRHKKYNFF